MKAVDEEGKEVRINAAGSTVRYLIVAALLAALCLEGYYIVMLRATIKKQTEDLRNISVQLQLLRSERETLSEEISAARKQAGENNDGNTTQR